MNCLTSSSTTTSPGGSWRWTTSSKPALGRCWSASTPGAARTGRMTMSLDDIRREIDQLDDQIVALLARRHQQVIRAVGYKSSLAAAAAPEQRVQMMRRLRAQASTFGGDPEVVTQVYTAMIDAFIELENRAIAEISSLSGADAGRRQRVSSG